MQSPRASFAARERISTFKGMPMFTASLMEWKRHFRSCFSPERSTISFQKRRCPMNQPFLLHVVERLESFAGKLPATIQKPILSELTPLKELFLRQRPPRFLLVGSNKIPANRILATIFDSSVLDDDSDPGANSAQWSELKIADRGSVSFLDARQQSVAVTIEEELKDRAADIILFVDGGESARGPRKGDVENLISYAQRTDVGVGAKIICLSIAPKAKSSRGNPDQLQHVLESKPALRDRLLGFVSFSSAEDLQHGPQKLMSILARELPNEARIEMIRISRNSEGQHEVAQILVKSTTAICTAIGAQPIPLADMPILTTLQLVMVSGIMYISGRERSLRAATEFVGALGANVGVGMLLREGTRALLKFFPGWGNVVCGMVAGAGTYAMGRAAIAFFLEGASIKDARKTYIASRKRPQRPLLLKPKKQQKQRTGAK